MAFKLEQFENRPVQAYFSNTIQLADVIASILEHIGAAEIVISTFSTSEEFLRRIWRLRKEGLITSASLFCDLKAARKTVHLYTFITSIFDTVYLAENHSKVVLLGNNRYRVAIVTSQNQTRGNRFECGIISSSPELYNQLAQGFAEMQDKSLPIDGLL